MFWFSNRVTELGPLWFGLVLIALDATAVVRALLRGHGVSSTLAWILAIITFPGAGAVAYLLLANPSIKRTVRRKATLYSGSIGDDILSISAMNGDDDRIVCLARELTGLRASANNEVDLLVEEFGAFEQIERDLANARETIWAEYYLVKNDETGHRFLDILAQRAIAGVEVRLLYDALGSLGLDGARLDAIRAAGGKVEPFLPLNPLRRRWAVHLRNHRKLIIVDGRGAFTGGMNVGDEYSGRSRLKGNQHFRDTHLRIRGPAVRDFAAVFSDDWKFATDQWPPLPDADISGSANSLVCPLPSGPDQRLNASAHVFFAAIMAARRQCYVTTPYFIPDEPTLRALITSAKSGVDVRVLLPARNDVRLVGAAARSFYRELVQGGVRIFEYQPSMLHAKCLVVDERWAIIGSANVDMRSFRLNFEVGALVIDPDLAGKLSRRFMADITESREITEAYLKKVGLGHKLIQGTARLMSPLL
jgi:cardiolipin synthase A/B